MNAKQCNVITFLFSVVIRAEYPLVMKLEEYLCKMHGYHQYFDFIHLKNFMVKKYFETKGQKGSCFIQGLRHLISK